jgi:hypothetical protein
MTACVFFLVENVVVTAVNRNNAELQLYKQKYQQQKKRGQEWKAWFEKKMRAKEDQIRSERLAKEQELKRVKKEEQKQLKLLTDQLFKVLSSSDSKKAAREQRPEDLVAMLAERVKSREERVAILTRELANQQREAERHVTALRHQFQEDQARHQNQVIKFVLKLQARDQAVLRQAAVAMDTERVIDVIERLYQDLDVRLLGVDCGLSFLMELPASRWRAVVDDQLATITNTLGGLLPDDVRQTTSWSDVTTYDDDVDLRLGRPLTVCVDPMTATPTKLFTLSPREPDDQYKPSIISIASLQDGTLALTDANNDKVTLLTLSPLLSHWTRDQPALPRCLTAHWQSQPATNPSSSFTSSVRVRSLCAPK